MASPQQTQGLTLEIRRTFAAPREKVFAAWVRREEVEKWMCRDVAAHLVVHHELDVRPGGRYLMEVRDQAKGETYWGQGAYREVRPPKKLVFTWSWTKDAQDGPNMHPDSPETVVTVEFFAKGESTEVVLTHARFASSAVRREHEVGWNGCFDILEKTLPQQ
jgi:uncharacterized protein YndB with AHSA1/START domain